MIIKHLLHKFNKATEQVSDKFSEWFGRPWFLLLNISFWVLWIGRGTEPFPYGELTMMLSMQAIIMSILILNAANVQQRKEREIAERDRQRDIAVRDQVDDIHEDVELIKDMLDEVLEDE